MAPQRKHGTTGSERPEAGAKEAAAQGKAAASGNPCRTRPQEARTQQQQQQAALAAEEADVEMTAQSRPGCTRGSRGCAAGCGG